MPHSHWMQDLLIYLAVAVVSVPLFSRLGLGSVMGYLVSGMIIGPWGLGWIQATQEVLHFSELGVVFLLFLIGLELEPHEVWKKRASILSIGSAQVLGSTLLLLFLLPLLSSQLGSLSLLSKGLIAFSLAMSSTAISLQILEEKKLRAFPTGQSTFAIALFQDLSVIPVLALLPSLASPLATETQVQAAHGVHPAWIGLGAIGAVVLLGRFLVRPAFRWIAQSGLRELFTAFSLFLVFGVAFIMERAGVSVALGAFLAGLLLANSEYKHELETDLLPFKGLLLGLFFISVGSGMNFEWLLKEPLQVLLLTFALLLIKSSWVYFVSRKLGAVRVDALRTGLLTSQGGEFAFVLLSQAKSFQFFSSDPQDLISLVVALSMAFTPVLWMAFEMFSETAFGNRILFGTDSNHASASQQAMTETQTAPVILAGYGRVGQVVGRFLHSQKIPVTILEKDPSQIEVVRKFGWKAFYGDVTRLDLLQTAGAEKAKILVLAIDDMEASQQTIELARAHFPHLHIIVRAESRLDAYSFIHQGLKTVRATLAPGLELAQETLRGLGYHAHEVQRMSVHFKAIDKRMLLKAAEKYKDEKHLIGLAIEHRQELERILSMDEAALKRTGAEGWSDAQLSQSK